jgi:prepilin-type N-terminal cleavage/methylation domain-containing protein
MNTNEKGFSLVELLVVVIIIAIVAAIAIPNLLASRRAANEASAISSLRTIHSSQATYQATIGGGVNYAADLPALNGRRPYRQCTWCEPIAKKAVMTSLWTVGTTGSYLLR